MEHTNSSIIEDISENILSIPYDKVKNKKFCGGNMFFGKISTFRSYFNDDTLSLIRPKLLVQSLECWKGGPLHHLFMKRPHSLLMVDGELIRNINTEIDLEKY